MSRIGVLAMQGAFQAHVHALQALGHQASAVRAQADLEPLDGLVLPGGESTTMLRLLGALELGPALDRWVRGGRPVLATCAGLILAARTVRRPAQASFGWLEVTVERNGWGPQVDSFEARDDSGELPLVLIRAPRIIEVGPEVEVLARYRGEPVLVRQGPIYGATFHPELTGDGGVHRRVFGAAAGASLTAASGAGWPHGHGPSAARAALS